MTFRRIDAYATDAPDKLADQLSRLEDNISDALSDVPEKLEWSDWQSSASGSNQLQAAYGNALRADTSVSALAVALPSISADTIGKLVGIKRKGANGVSVYPIESTALIDGAASVTLGADGLYLYVHDGTEWSRY